MRKFAIILSTVLLATGALRAQEFGAPSPAGDAGHFTLGGALSHSSTDYKNFSGSISSNRLYAEGAYAFTGDWEGYARLGAYGQDGARNTGAGNCYYDAYGNFICNGTTGNYSTKPFAGLGLRGLFWKREVFAIGMVAQFNWRANSSYAYSYTTGSNFNTVRVSLRSQFDIAAGPAFQWTTPGKFKVYAGPFAYTTSGTQDTTLTTTNSGGTSSINYSTDYKDKDNVGLFAGIRIPFGHGWNFNAEAQARSGYVIGAGFSRTF